MFHRKDAVSMAVVGLLASCGLAMADTTQVTAPSLSLDPTVVTAQDSGAPSTPLMMLLDKVGAAKPIQSAGINIYGWVEAGYTANLRNNAGSHPNSGLITRPLGFTEEIGNHVELNQIVLRIEKVVDSKKWDVGGLIEAAFGTDENFIEANGFQYQTPGNNPGEVPHFNFSQAYVDVNVPVGNGIKIRTGLFYPLIGYESNDPRGNAFYSHSYLFFEEPLSNTGVVGFYQINDQISVAGGITRGFNQSTEDVNGSPDGVVQVAWTPNKQWSFTLTGEFGPQNPGDTSHYDTFINPIVTWQATDALKFAAEGIYQYDGGINAGFTGSTHSYGDNYGLALYAGYTINDYLTANARAEWLHNYTGIAGTFANTIGVPSINLAEVTLGVTIKPMPKDPIGQNLSLRPEFRYDMSEDNVFQTPGGGQWKNQMTVACDVIFTF